MNPHVKKLIGTILMVAFVAIYALVIVAVAPRILTGASKLTEMLVLSDRGARLVVPLLPLIRWMERKKGPVA